MCADPWPLRSECCGRGVPTKVVCAECMKMCCLGGKNSVVKGLNFCILCLTHTSTAMSMCLPCELEFIPEYYALTQHVQETLQERLHPF